MKKIVGNKNSCKKKIKKAKYSGYTLIELLAVVVIISIIFVIFFSNYNRYIETVNEGAIKVETEHLIDATASYYNEFKKEKDYIYYKDDNNVVYSCISINSLINKGFYNTNVDFINKKINKKNSVIKVTDKDGVLDYELIPNYMRDKDCIYYALLNEINNDNSDINITNNDENNKVTLKTDVVKNVVPKNSFTLKIKLTAHITKELVTYKLPLYTLEVLDKSSSMTGNKYTNAVEASKLLSKNLIDKVDNSYIGLINFSKEASLQRDFFERELVDSEFAPISQGTNILHALNLAYEKMSTVDEEAIKYVIFLTDGEPYANYRADSRCNTYSSRCDKALIEYSDRIKNNLNATFIVIGYDINKDIYKKIATEDVDGSLCKDSDYQKDGINYCYYSSNSDNISELFDNISNEIQKNVNAHAVKSAKLNANFDKVIKLYDALGNEHKNINLNMNFDDDKEEIEIEYEYIVYVDELDEDIFSCDFDKKTCSYHSKLFDKYYISLFDKDDIELKKIELNSPTVTIIKELKSYVN